MPLSLKIKKKFTELSDEELKQVTGGKLDREYRTDHLCEDNGGDLTQCPDNNGQTPFIG